MRTSKPPAERATIVTAWVAPDEMAVFHRMRQAFFPGHRNFLSAHVTLFHHLRPSVRDEAIDFARQFAWSDHLSLDAEGRLPVRILDPFSMGKGVAYALEPEPLQALRSPLRNTYDGRLTDQDARPWKKPHITVQNKVEKPQAARLLRHLKAALARPTPPLNARVRQLHVLGLSFYRYDYGPWAHLVNIPLLPGPEQ